VHASLQQISEAVQQTSLQQGVLQGTPLQQYGEHVLLQQVYDDEQHDPLQQNSEEAQKRVLAGGTQLPD